MTVVYRKVSNITTVTTSEFVSRDCDWCGCSLPEKYGNEDCRTREFQFTSGYSFPGDASGTGWYISDLCDDCVDKLRDVLVSVGIKLTEIDY